LLHSLSQLSKYGAPLRPFGIRAAIRLAGLLFAKQSSRAASLLHDHELRRSAVTVGQYRTKAGYTLAGSVSVADGLRDAGRYEEALANYQAILRAIEESQGKESKYYGVVLGSVANTLQCMGKLTDALQAFDRSQSIFGRVLGKNHPAYASSLCNRGTCLRELGRYKDAVASIEESLHILRSTHGE